VPAARRAKTEKKEEIRLLTKKIIKVENKA
jgi:hypothetical protein